MVNGVRITSQELSNGDTIRCGDVFISYVEDPQILQEINVLSSSGFHSIDGAGGAATMLMGPEQAVGRCRRALADPACG